MTLKGWMLRKVNGPNKPRDRGRVAPSVQGLAPADAGGREPSLRGAAEQRKSMRETIAHLGPYATLIAAVRDELEQFVASHLRLHLAIAEHDRYVLTSIEVECEGSDEHRELLRRFMSEFKPEQIKQYLAREVIAGLRNASAIDLSQFAGLNAAENLDPPDEDDYAGLLAELRSGAPGSTPRPYAVSLVGRWSSSDAAAAASGAARASHGRTRQVNGPATNATTPLAGQSFALDIEDAAGARSIELGPIAPGRSYVVGKDEDCDVVVDGVYVSRRHCEIWFDNGAWFVTDLTSTNGIRIESDGVVVIRAIPHATERVESIELPAGSWLVLSAHAEEDPAKCPRLALRRQEAIPAVTAERAALTTPIAPVRRRRGTLTVAAHMASGLHEADVLESALPFRIGRSRNQELVIDWTHDEVSARHIEIVAIDEAGASVVVHGDNGVTLDGKAYGSGSRLRWNPGETLLLGNVDGKSPACTLTLSRAA
jgi:pSer/pThr/pTyr-binding forkhead associated (FHA) protein